MITLDDLLDKGFLRVVHDAIRSSVRSNHLPQALLVKDPTLLSDFQFELEDSFRLLRQKVLRGDYRPEPPVVIRAAKGTGLRRPLTFLRHDDAVLLSALTRAVRNGVQQSMPPWVSFGRTDQEKPRRAGKTPSLGILEPDSSNWFREWMQYRGLLRLIEGDQRPLLVVSDVANFFPYLDLETLRASFTAKSLLDAAGTNLLFFVLDQLLPRDQYAPRSKLGLPQDPYDASRILAHYYLSPLDAALDVEGRTDRYTRWVDDIAVSVADEVEGAAVIARIQDALNRIGLAPNATKTRIVSKDRFRREHFERYNGFLDVVRRRTDMRDVDDRFRRTFDRWLSRFFDEPRTGEWVRILRRFYTESRRMGNGRLSTLAAEHLTQFPAEASRILDYLCYRPARENSALAIPLFDLMAERAEIYEDFQILFYEWLLLAPFMNDPILRGAVTLRALEHLKGSARFSAPIPYVRGLLSFVVLKFGGLRALPSLCAVFEKEIELDPAHSTSALYVLSADSAMRARAWRKAEHLRDPQVMRLRRFLIAVEGGDQKATGLALGLVSVAPSDLPTRAIFRARALPMLYLLKGLPAVAGKLKTIQRQNDNLIVKQPDAELRDHVMESHF